MAARSKTSSKSKAASKSSAGAGDTVASAAKAADAAVDAATIGMTAMSAMNEGAGAFNRKCIDFAKANMEASFELATSLAAAKSPVDAMRLQADFMRTQYESMAAQSRELAELAGEAMRGTGNPFADLMTKSGWPLSMFGKK